MKKGKLKKELKKYFKDYRFNKHHFYYTALIMIILVLSIFLFNNYNKCHIYEINTSTNSFNVKNGTLVLTPSDSILKINDITYNGEVENATDLEISLYVLIGGKEYLINSFSATSEEGFNINDYLSGLSFEINENENNYDVFTNQVRKNIKDNLYIRVSMFTLDNDRVDENINLNVENLYSNNKLFY